MDKKEMPVMDTITRGPGDTEIRMPLLIDRDMRGVL